MGNDNAIPIVQTSLNHPQICPEAFIIEPGFICELILVIVAQNPRDESEIVDGPFRLTDESIERDVSANAEYSRRSHWRIVLMRMQAALDAGCEVEARDVISQALCQHGFREGVFASGVQAMLHGMWSVKFRESVRTHTHLAIASMVHEDRDALSSAMFGVRRWRSDDFESRLIWPLRRNGINCKAQTRFMPKDEKESRNMSSTADVKHCLLNGASGSVRGTDERIAISSVNCSKLATAQTTVQLCSDLVLPRRGLTIGFPNCIEFVW